MSTPPPITRLQYRELLGHGGAEHEKRVGSRDQESSDSDFSEGPLPREGGNTDNLRLAVAAAEKRVREKLVAAEKVAAEKVAAEMSVVVEGPGGDLIPDGQEIGERLKDVIMLRRKGLQKMYGETEDELNQNLEWPIRKGEEMARKLIGEMGCPRAIAKDLAVLTLYDVAILICMFWC